MIPKVEIYAKFTEKQFMNMSINSYNVAVHSYVNSENQAVIDSVTYKLFHARTIDSDSDSGSNFEFTLDEATMLIHAMNSFINTIRHVVHGNQLNDLLDIHKKIEKSLLSEIEFSVTNLLDNMKNMQDTQSIKEDKE